MMLREGRKMAGTLRGEARDMQGQQLSGQRAAVAVVELLLRVDG